MVSDPKRMSPYVAETVAHAPPRPVSHSQFPWGFLQMFGTFLAACCLGIGHHFYYSRLDGTVAVNQSVSVAFPSNHPETLLSAR